MPLHVNTPNRLNIHVPSGRHIIDSRAVFNAPHTQPPLGVHRNRWQEACENFAIRALQPNALDPPSVFTDILMDGLGGYVAQNPLHNLPLHAEYPRYRLIRQTVRAVFGSMQAGYTVAALPPSSHNPFNRARHNAKVRRNGFRQQLHTLTAEVFEMCLRYNGFTLSNVATDYVVCTEYECATTQDMYPNHTHSWLLYRGRRIIQKIPGAHISVSRHQAGHQPHCGMIRRYVTDFHATQDTIIDEIMSHRHTARRGVDPVVGCNLHDDVGPAVVLDELSPDE